MTFADVSPDAWYAPWIEEAYRSGLIPACEGSPGLWFCPEGPFARAHAAHGMVKAKSLDFGGSDPATLQPIAVPMSVPEIVNPLRGLYR